ESDVGGCSVCAAIIDAVPATAIYTIATIAMRGARLCDGSLDIIRRTATVTLIQGYVPLEPRDFFFADVLSNLAAKLIDRLVRPVLFEFTEHPVAEPRNGEDVSVAGSVQIDWNEHVLFEAREFG